MPQNSSHGAPMTSPKQDEADLVARACSGERGALERLLFMHHDRLRRSIRRRLPRAVAQLATEDDVLQETLIRAFRGIQAFSYHGPESFYSWLSTIAGNYMKDLMRKQSAAKRGGDRARLQRADSDDSGEGVESLLAKLAIDEHSPSRSVARREAIAALHVALASIKRECRDASDLRYFEGLSVTEVAQRMGKTDRAVHMLCYRGLERLREAMGRASQYLTWH